jgi:hypothetical protein
LIIPACVEVSATVCGHHRGGYGDQLQRDEDPERQAFVYGGVAAIGVRRCVEERG